MPSGDQYWSSVVARPTFDVRESIDDPYADYVSFVLRGSAADADTRQIKAAFTVPSSSSPARPGTARGCFGPFNGTTGYVEYVDILFDLGTEDFCIEAWVYPVSTAASYYIAGNYSAASGSQCVLGFHNSPFSPRIVYGGGTVFTSTGLTGTLNTWQHLCVVRRSSQVTLFLDGVESTNSAVISSLGGGNSVFTLGRATNTATSAYDGGYMSDVRFTKGHHRYGGPYFSLPPELSATTLDWASATVALKCNGTNGSTTFTDEKGNTITANGNAQISTTQWKYGSASAYFDGTVGTYLSIPSFAGMQFGTGAFRVECWIYPTATPGAEGGWIVGRGEHGLNNDWIIKLDSSNKIAVTVGSAGVVVTSATAAPNNQWTHVAVLRNTSRNIIQVFINGYGTPAAISAAVSSENTGSGNYTIGADVNGDEARFTGYIDDLLVVKGAYSYTTNFVPPTEIPASSSYYSDPAINSALGVVTGFGTTPLLSTTQSKFGGRSMRMIGKPILLHNSSSQYVFGTGEWTIEMWVRFDSVSVMQMLYDARPPSTNGQYVTIFLNTDGKLHFYVNTATRLASTTGLSANTWHHIALVRDNVTGGAHTYRWFIDGAAAGTLGDPGYSFLCPAYSGPSTSRPYVGVSGYDGTFATTAYIDDLRVTKGVCRYRTAFTAPTAAHPVAGYTYNVSGTVQELGSPVARLVRAHDMTSGEIVGFTTSDAGTGAYSISLSGPNKVYIVAFDDVAGSTYNALIESDIEPTPL